MNTELTNIEYAKRGTGAASRRLTTAIALGALLLFQSGAQAQDNPAGASGSVDPLVGTWNTLVDIYDCNTGATIATGGQALALFNADGTRHETNATNPALRTPGYGRWSRMHKLDYEFAFKFYRFNESGVFIGSTNVRHNLFLSADKLSYYSEGTAEFLTRSTACCLPPVRVPRRHATSDPCLGV
jgi:hypothetical protein